jgi:hypothetical protein
MSGKICLPRRGDVMWSRCLSRHGQNHGMIPWMAVADHLVPSYRRLTALQIPRVAVKLALHCHVRHSPYLLILDHIGLADLHWRSCVDRVADPSGIPRRRHSGQVRKRYKIAFNVNTYSRKGSRSLCLGRSLAESWTMSKGDTYRTRVRYCHHVPSVLSKMATYLVYPMTGSLAFQNS